MASRQVTPQQWARSILSNWATFVLSAGVNFFLSPIIVRSLGETQYGAWALLGSLVGHLGLLDLGVRAAVTRYMAQFHAASEHERASQLYATALRIFAIAGTIAVVLATGMSLLIGSVFTIPPELLHIARVVAVLGGLNVAASLIGGVFGGVLTGLERFDYGNAIEIVVGVALRTIGVVVALKLGYGLIGLAIVQLIATLLRTSVTAYYVRKLYPELLLTTWTWDSESARLIFKYGLTASMLHVTGTLMAYGDSIILGAMLPIGMITYFAIAGNLIDYARSVVTGISQTLSPRLSALQAGGQHDALRQALLTSARLSSLVVLPIAVTFLLRGDTFIGIWMGPEYADLAGQILWILALTLIPLAGYQIMTAAMFGIGKHGTLIPMFLAEGAANFALSIIWVHYYGVIGTAFGTMVPRLIVSILIGPWYVRRALGVPLGTFWSSVFVRPLIAMIPFAAASYAVNRFWPAHNLAVYFGQVVLLLPLVAVAAYLACLAKDEQAILRTFLGSVGRRVTRRAG